MNVAKVLVIGLLLAFTAFLFPELQTACSGASGTLAPLIQNFPIILLAIEAGTMILIAWKGK